MHPTFRFFTGTDVNLRRICRGYRLHFSRQSHRPQAFKKRVWIEFLDVDHGLCIPGPLRNQDGRRHRRDPCRVGDGLRFHFLITGAVIADVVDEDFALSAVLFTLDQVPDTGLALVVRRQGGGVRQAGRP